MSSIGPLVVLHLTDSIKSFGNRALESFYWMEGLVKHHMALCRRDKCTVLPPPYWIRRSFNVCVMVSQGEVRSSRSYTEVVFLNFRSPFQSCPMPQKLAEARYPGSIDEKVR